MSHSAEDPPSEGRRFRSRSEYKVERWTNSWFGRLLGIGLGVFALVLGIQSVAEQDIGMWWLSATILIISGLGLIVSFCSSQLSIEKDELIARDFWRTRCLSLGSITVAEPGIIGLFFKSVEGRRMRSMTSGMAFDELWRTRAERICAEVVRRADQARKS